MSGVGQVLQGAAAALAGHRAGFGAALRRGERKVIWSSTRTGDEPDAGTFAFERGDPAGAYALVVFNTNQTHPSTPEFNGAPMKTSLPGGTVLVDVLSDQKTTYTVGGDGSVAVTLPPESGAILVPQDQAQ